MQGKSRRAGIAASVVLASACGSADRTGVEAQAQAEHSWNGYHWPSYHLEPSVADRTGTAAWKLADRVQDWKALGTPIQPALTSATKGDVAVIQQTSALYLGLAQVWVDGGHISRAKVVLNPVLLDPPYTAAGVAHVACQELGHVWGLDHQHVDTSCMDDCQTPGLTNEQWLACINDPGRGGPNAHDAEELVTIYNHTDATGGGPGPPCSKNPTHPNCTGASGWITVHTVGRRD